MIIEFSVTNFRSLKDTQTLSLVASPGTELPKNIFSVDKYNLNLLRSISLYGPNAGGKSNFIKALHSMKSIVVESAKSTQEGELLPINPFLLDPKSKTQPAEFEIIFIVDNIRFQYGFSATSKRIFEEWLIAFPKNKSQKWYHRIWNPQEEIYNWYFSNFFYGEKNTWQNSTRDNALFLSTAVLLNSKQLTPIYNWFRNYLRFLNPRMHTPFFTARLLEENKREKIMAMLKASDLSIENFVVEKKKINDEILISEMPEEFKNIFRKNTKEANIYKIKTIHKNSDGKEILFDLADESDGTQKMFCLAGPWIDVLENGYTLVVDELNTHLHPKLAIFLVRLFNDQELNKNNAQLIFTSHETWIMNQEILRRDQVWFCEKNENQETEVYSLTDFSPRKDRENIEKAYRSGRYGAMPFINENGIK